MGLTKILKFRKRSEQNQRIATAIVIGAIVIFCIVMGIYSTAALFFTIAVFGGIEMSKMLDIIPSKIMRVIHIFISVLFFIILEFYYVPIQVFIMAITLNCLFLSYLVFDLIGFNLRINYNSLKFSINGIYWSLPLALMAHYTLHINEKANLYIFGMIILLWTSDSMAYFTGRKYGKHKLLPSVSPGKTIEGSIGGGIFTIIVAIIYAVIINEFYFLK